MLPEGWVRAKLGEIIKLSSGDKKPNDTVKEISRSHHIPVYGGNGIMGYSTLSNTSSECISIGRVGEYCGSVHAIKNISWITDNSLYTKEISKNCNFLFIYYLLTNSNIPNLRNKGGQPLVSQKPIYGLPILLPPLPEQKKIAAILSTWDRAIEGTEKLLANSQQQKKALMQQLLTGKKRLPGFTGEWQVHRLGEIADFLKGKGLSKADINPKGKTPCIHYGSLFTEQPSTITETKTLTNTFKGAVFSKKNDVLMPTSDVTPAGLAVASAIQKDNVLLGNDILIIRPNYEQLYGPFLSRIIRNSKKKILSFATGTTVFHLYASDMKRFQLLVPPLPEQKAIAAVLTTADEEITALESDLSRLRQEKKALMQQLLTGKIRVAV